MITYETSVPFTGDPGPAIAAARLFLGANGFKVDQPNNAELLATGPGMRSTRQNPILGVTSGRLKFTGRSIDFTGELGGVEFMRKFLCYFPPGLALGLMISFCIAGVFVPDFPWVAVAIAPLAVLPWIFISPLMLRSITKKTHAAVDTLLENIATVTPGTRTDHGRLGNM